MFVLEEYVREDIIVWGYFLFNIITFAFIMLNIIIETITVAARRVREFHVAKTTSVTSEVY